MKRKKESWCGTVIYLGIIVVVIAVVMALELGFFQWIFNSDLPDWLKYFILK